MKPNSTALAVSLLSSVLLLNAQAATARKPAGHDNSDYRRSQSRSHGEENERGRKADGRHRGQVT
jgi:hypothetical protein